MVIINWDEGGRKEAIKIKQEAHRTVVSVCVCVREIKRERDEDDVEVWGDIDIERHSQIDSKSVLSKNRQLLGLNGQIVS